MQELERWPCCIDTISMSPLLSQRLADALDPTEPEEEEVWGTLDLIGERWTNGEVGGGNISFRVSGIKFFPDFVVSSPPPPAAMKPTV